MTTEQQIIAIAELDGKLLPGEYAAECCPIENCGIGAYVNGICKRGFPCYLTSRDAIVPAIEKVCKHDVSILEKFASFAIQSKIVVLEDGRPFNTDLFDEYGWSGFIFATPAQLCEALLRATNKWVD
jgi:hypothetical protein